MVFNVKCQVREDGEVIDGAYQWGDVQLYRLYRGTLKAEG